MPASPAELVQNSYDAFRRRDLPTIFSLMSPEIDLEQSTELPWGGTYRGHDGARQFFTNLTSHVTSTVQVERLIAAADHIAVVGWTEGTVNANGKPFRVPIVHVWTVQNGLVVRIQFLIDHSTMLQALPQG